MGHEDEADFLPSISQSFSTTTDSDTPAPTLCRHLTSSGEAGHLCSSTDDLEPPYNVYSRRQKWGFAGLVSLAGCLSPMSTNLYFPVVAAIASDLKVTESMIGLTITVYMIVQGIAPLPLGALSDTTGRRLVLIATLTVYTAVNLALSYTSSYAMLLALRGLQAAGSAAATSISVGVIADLASPNERGSFMGMHAGIRMSLQAVGPVIGGVLDSEWGFRSIFWMLFAFSLPVLMSLVIFLPETHRDIAGDGRLPLAGYHRPLIYMLRTPKEWTCSRNRPRRCGRPLTFKLVFAPLAHIFNRDILVLLLWGALVFTVWSVITSSTTATMLLVFPHLTRWQLGLCFLPNGLGCITGSVCTGLLLDRLWERTEALYKLEHRLSRVDTKGHRTFPFERARLSPMPYFGVVLIIALALYGPSFRINELNLPRGADLAVPLGLQFVIGFTATAIFDICSTLLVDYFPHGSAGASAVNNLCRCMLGAAGEGSIQPLLDAVGVVHTYLILAAAVVVFSPLIWVLMRWGEPWRFKREKLNIQDN